MPFSSVYSCCECRFLVSDLWVYQSGTDIHCTDLCGSPVRFASSQQWVIILDFLYGWFCLFSSSPYGSYFFLILGHTGNHCWECGVYLVPISVLESISFSLCPPTTTTTLASPDVCVLSAISRNQCWDYFLIEIVFFSFIIFSWVACFYCAWFLVKYLDHLFESLLCSN